MSCHVLIKRIIVYYNRVTCVRTNLNVWLRTVTIQLGNGPSGFDRSWAEFKAGFGDSTTAPYWIGNDNLHELTTHLSCAMRLDVVGVDGNSYWHEYDTIRVDSEANTYFLNLFDYRGGTIVDVYNLPPPYWVNGKRFFTYDRDSSIRCATNYHGGFWYDICTLIAINGYDRNHNNQPWIIHVGNIMSSRMSMRDCRFWFFPFLALTNPMLMNDR